jgi:hypothetical protein
VTSAPEQQTALTTTFSNIANNVVSQLAAACAATDVSITLLSGTGASFPAAPFYVSVEYEVLWCSNKTGDVLQVSRGVDGTTAAPHPVNAIIQIRNNAGLFLDAYDAIHELDNGIVTGSALPANVAYTDKVQSFTNKTIDLINGNNTIIGNVSPDPAQLVYQNILDNGGFEEWTFVNSTSLAAGTPTSGGRTAFFANYWQVYGVNDSSVSVTKDSANIDAASPSSTDVLVNVSTVQANDYVMIYQNYNSGQEISAADILKLIGNVVSSSTRIKSLSGNVQVRFQLAYYNASLAFQSIQSNWMPLTTNYATYKFENQVWLPQSITTPLDYIQFAIQFKGVGQIAVDNAMSIVGPVATTYRAKPSKPAPTYNLLVNGGFEIWQRGTSFTNVPNGSFSPGPDRWNIAGSGSSTHNCSKNTSDVPDGNASCNITTNFQAGVTTFAQTIASAEFNLPNSSGRVLTASIRIKTSNAGYCQLGIYNGTTWVYAPFATADGSWHTYNISSFCSGTVVYMGVNFATSGSCIIDAAQLVIGHVPGIFVQPSPADELARCLRYYEIIGEMPTSFQRGVYLPATGSESMVIFYKARKAVAPTATKNGTWALSNTTTQPSLAQVGNDLLAFILGPATAIGMLAVGNNASGNNITLEANP